MNNLKEIIESLKFIRTETTIKFSDEVLFENAIKIYISREIGKQKEFNFKEYPKKETFEPITGAQLKFLKFNDKRLRSLGFDVDNIQSKQDAHKVIKQFKEL